MQIFPVRQNFPGSGAAAVTGRSPAAADAWTSELGAASGAAASTQPADAAEAGSASLSAGMTGQLIAAQARQGATATPPKPLALASLADTLDYGKMRAKAEQGLAAEMQKLGIPSDTKVDLTIGSDGHIRVATDSRYAKELETAVNGNSDLRNAIVATDNAARTTRIVAEMQKAQSAIAADPAHANEINAWLVSTAQGISASSTTLEMSGGRLDAWFGTGGQQVGVLDNLVDPPSFG